MYQVICLVIFGFRVFMFISKPGKYKDFSLNCKSIDQYLHPFPNEFYSLCCHVVLLQHCNMLGEGWAITNLFNTIYLICLFQVKSLT